MQLDLKFVDICWYQLCLFLLYFLCNQFVDIKCASQPNQVTASEAASPPYTLSAKKAEGRNGQVNGERNIIQYQWKMNLFFLSVFLRTTKAGAPFRGFMIMAEVGGRSSFGCAHVMITKTTHCNALSSVFMIMCSCDDYQDHSLQCIAICVHDNVLMW